ncbi:MAG: peroxiredoxin-like family protein [Bacteroidota bacterium]
MKLTLNSLAPSFTTHNIYGHEINSPDPFGKKTYLAFERNAGCPVCNLRTHELLKNADYFKSRNISMYLIYESPVDKMKQYLGENSYPFQFISDPQNQLYNLYGVKRSMLGVMRGLFNGILTKVSAGNKLFSKPMRQDGHLDRIPAEFIIDQRGKIVLAHYGKFVGDHLPINTLMKHFEP